MPSPSTTSLILFENTRVTRSMTKLAAQGCAAAVIVRRPLAERTASVNFEAPLPVARKSSPVNRPAAKPPLPYKAGFGFTLGGPQLTPEERERLRKERLAFSRRGRAYRERKGLPTVKVWVASASSRDRYEREFVGQTGFYRIVPSPALLAPPATNYRDQVLSPDMFFLVPGVRELAPHEWDEWQPTRRPEHSRVVDASKLFVPLTCSSGNLSPDDLKRYFPREWYTARAAEIRKARIGKKRRARRDDSAFLVAVAVLAECPHLSPPPSASRRWRPPHGAPATATSFASSEFGPMRRLHFKLLVAIFCRFGHGMIGVSACKAQEVHSGRGCIFSLAKSTPGMSQCRFKLDGRRGALWPRVCVVVCRPSVRACSLCHRAIGDPLPTLSSLQYFMKLIALFGGVVREQGWSSSAFDPTSSAIFAKALWFYAGEIRRVSTSRAKEYTLAEHPSSQAAFLLTRVAWGCRPAPKYTLAEGCALAPAPGAFSSVSSLLFSSLFSPFVELVALIPEIGSPQSGAYIAQGSLGKWGCTLAEGLPLIAHEDGA
ncbi:hypothetical protein EDB87DRAFT_1823361 [Lactarius vividus]|nr:hypothetical protein EDB87DRAFT_1823361 [Lactarius vividus]